MKWLIAALVLLAVAGCGYQFAGRAEVLPSGVRTVAVELFANQTTQPALENEQTEQIAAALSRLAGVRLSNPSTQTDAVVRGRILTYDTPVIAYDSADAISKYLVKMTVELELVRSRDGKLLWQNRLSWQEPFAADSDRMKQRDAENSAAAEVHRRIAEEFIFQLMTDF
ncbi:MAG: hypothetical protein C0618_04540 [Desulfuromonas sp.]|nr:MAG: hypothetical protein C0618_04540 [Desulfuromonas sp.]